MSRSYNEDWERKKSYLIRSLFHDIPFRALSPVPECSEEISTKSTDSQLPQESSSSQIYSESKTTTSSTPSYPVPASTDVYPTLDSRPHSPLPPLIIERMPNKHDDPPEYYQTLLNKIRIIYRKMFIEGKYLSDDDFLDSDNEKQSILNEIFEMAGSLSDVSEVSTDGYSADTETSDYEESIDNLGDFTLNIENYNRIQVAKDIDKLLESNNAEDYSVNDDFAGDNNIPVNNQEMAGESVVSEEEAGYRQITTQADVHIDGAQLAAISPSPVYEGTPAQVTPMVTAEAEPSTPSTEELAPDPPDSRNIDPSPETALVFDINQEYAGPMENAELLENVVPLENASPLDNAEPLANSELLDNVELPENPRLLANAGPLDGTEDAAEELPLEPNTGLTYESAAADQIVIGSEASLGAPTVNEDLITSPILPFARRPIRGGVYACQERPEVSEREDAHNRQTTTQTETDTKSSSEHEVSKTAQEQAFILRFSKSIEHSFAREATIVEGHQEPLQSSEDLETSNHVEVIRTPRPRSSLASIPLDTTRFSNDMDLTCERDFNPRDISTVTSPSQNGGGSTNSDHRQTSCGIDDVLSSIFNVSLQGNIENASKRSNGRKRMYEEMSAQTENVSWSDLRANFFVGTPKIFRLCTCVDHVCNWD